MLVLTDLEESGSDVHIDTGIFPFPETVLIADNNKDNKKTDHLDDPFLHLMVHQTRLELVRVAPHAPQTCAYTYSATGASLTIIEYIFDFV